MLRFYTSLTVELTKQLKISQIFLALCSAKLSAFFAVFLVCLTSVIIRSGFIVFPKANKIECAQ